MEERKNRKKNILNVRRQNNERKIMEEKVLLKNKNFMKKIINIKGKIWIKWLKFGKIEIKNRMKWQNVFLLWNNRLKQIKRNRNMKIKHTTRKKEG